MKRSIREKFYVDWTKNKEVTSFTDFHKTFCETAIELYAS